MRPAIAIEDARFFVRNMRTRFPFRYGIASLTSLPHLFLRLKARVNGIPATGISSEGLPPKWFTKDLETPFEEDLLEMLRVITHAADLSREVGGHEQEFFSFWEGLHAAQSRWALAEGIAPLLANLGVSVIERALLDAVCRNLQRPFGAVLRQDQLGIDLAAVRPELGGLELEDFLPPSPLRKIAARHTIGLADPITAGDIGPSEHLEDGLPHALEDCIATYGCRYFKIKLCGDPDQDSERLVRLSGLFERMLGNNYHFTLDGNESHLTVGAFLEHWETLHRQPSIRRLMGHLLFVEQPLHRDVALDDSVADALRAWQNHPHLIIDESDATLADLPRALELGYAGCSHKNCKGVVKGLVNAAVLARRRQTHPGHPAILSGEDLANVGPVALLQDLCVMANLGIPHVERNGHHYFRGLSAFPRKAQRAVVEQHSDLYSWHDGGFASLLLVDGGLSTDSVTRNSFGVGPLIDFGDFTPLDAWAPPSLNE